MESTDSTSSNCKECPLKPYIAEKLAQKIDDYFEKTEQFNAKYQSGEPINSRQYNSLQTASIELFEYAKSIDTLVENVASIQNCEGPVIKILDENEMLKENLCPVSQDVLKTFGVS